VDIVVRARGGVPGVEASIDEVRAVLRALRHTDFRAPDPFGVVTPESLQQLWRQISAAAFILSLLIASVSLGVGGIVIMNIMLVAVVERTREIGVRLAIGAERRDVLALVVGGGMRLAAVGVAIGLAGALGLTQLITTMLYNVTPFDPLSYAVTASVLLMIAAIACYVPARRAMNVDPLVAIREE
jgi:putative ABC transport system permease protein